MARSRTKQGNRKNRVKAYYTDEDGNRRLQKDEHGNQLWVGVISGDANLTIWEIRERTNRQAAFWQRIKDQREAKRQLEEEQAAAELVGA